MTLNILAVIVFIALLFTPPVMAALSIRDSRRMLEMERRYRAAIAANIRQQRNDPAKLDELADLIDPEKMP